MDRDRVVIRQEEQLDANLAVWVAAIATVIYAFLTLLLLFEARLNRNTRLEANVATYPTPHAESGMYLDVIAENYGPASATDVVVIIRLLDESGNPIGSSEQRLAEPVWGPGRLRKFMPRPDSEGQITVLNELAGAGMSLYLEWSWTDGRRSLRDIVVRRPTRQHHIRTFELRKYREDIYGGKAMIDHDPLNALPKIREELERLRRVIEKIHGTMDGPAMRIWISELTANRSPTEEEAQDPDPKAEST